MSEQNLHKRFSTEILSCLDETFEHVQGIYLDKGTALFETLESLSAEDASCSVAEGSATIAAQVEHIRFYLDVLNDVMHKKEVGKVDWQDIWQNVRAVAPEEWDQQKRRLRESYERVLVTLKSFDSWEGEETISGALSVLVHSAYHLGGIRQAWGAIKSAGASNTATK
jgi:hypothetical protein